MRLSVLIKTYNEGGKIAKCIKSVLDSVRGIEGGVEIIVADSLSTDDTVEIAKNYDVKVVQLRAIEDRGCGSGVQLGFQHSSGRYVYLLDGDMELQPGFLSQALELLESDVHLAGVSGLLRDRTTRNWFERQRNNYKPTTPGEVACLHGGGLYRRNAIENSGGYAGNRNLQAFEEAELGFRLRSQGWRLVRLPVVAILHTGHTGTTRSLIGRLWRNGRVASGGVFLKLALAQPYRFDAIRMFIHPLATLAYWLIWLVSLILVEDWRILAGLAGFGLLVYACLVFKKRSFRDAAISMLLWHLAALGIIRGFTLRNLHSPNAEIPSVVLKESEPEVAAVREKLPSTLAIEPKRISTANY
ncbi:Glycosyltransferase, GT2 family [Nitrosospira multiformis]|uniref:Glycosyltransferase, GT2 family n=1 Tax=Nitrosospira multiformis TaxID=1231 RepID=A0A1H8MCW1_9PROT|nr:glycosyltransferase family 2 protein [Nitrosospira multiformis]SEO14996.1 Glycosyltransferase, GT2 family [Nitrosospira multiformis]